MTSTGRKRFTTLAAAAVLVLGTAACSPRIEVRGNLPDKERLAQIQLGSMSREEVAEILGSPSTVTPFDSDTWLYISEKTSTVAFLAPDVEQRNVIMLKFDKKGVVQDMKKLDLSNAKDIKQVERITPTSGNEVTFWGQLLGNLGRFNPAGGGENQGGPSGNPANGGF